ncbi:MAG TPA: DNA recombination protein RmuC [Phycisphaerae bacterium]|nr:DNA recombination protein RmuC [Phycisphaerae bacterium]
MTEAVLLLVGVLIGGAIGVWLGLLRGRSEMAGEVSGLTASLGEVRGQLSAREVELQAARQALEAAKVAGAESKAWLEAEQKNLARQREQFEQDVVKLRETFATLSADALKSNNEQFVVLADAKMKPLREQLERYEKQIAELEKDRSEAYGGLKKAVSSLDERSERLDKGTAALVAALRHGGAKGKWGEIALQRIVELTGMTEHCDFEKQVSLAGESGRQRPDLTIHLPGGRTLVVDSKVNTDAYLDAVNATDEAERGRCLEKYAKDVLVTLRDLGGKEYWKQFTPAPALVVMFMPSEAFFAAALSQEGDLIAKGLNMHVLPASPTTLIALLHAVRHGWQQQQAAENAQKIVDAGRELYDRLCVFVGHLDAVRQGIAKAGEAYDKALGNWEKRTLPSARRLKELGAAEAGKDLPELTAAELNPRPWPAADDAQAGGS